MMTILLLNYRRNPDRLESTAYDMNQPNHPSRSRISASTAAAARKVGPQFLTAARTQTPFCVVPVNLSKHFIAAGHILDL
jgi:hypothetical protein